MRRRELLTGLGAITGLAACATPPPVLHVAAAPADPQVRAQMDRVTRTVVGLRPFRPAGFRLEAEEIAGRLIVHNYGHGGCGVTLSWGTSLRAADMAAGEGPVAVLGCGVMGITTALILARRGRAVTLYAAAFPPHTTSNIAGALWLPSGLYDRRVASDEFHKLNHAVTRQAHARFLPYVNRPGYGVYWIHHSDLSNRSSAQTRALGGGDDLYPALERRTAPQTRFGFPSERRFYTLMIDPDFYLEALLEDARLAGARTEKIRFDSRSDALALPERTIVNCLGLGAARVFGDDTLIPVRGQLSHLLPQPEIDYSYVAPGPGHSLYMFPRRTGLVLGGTHQRGNDSLETDAAMVSAMVDGHGQLSHRAGEFA